MITQVGHVAFSVRDIEASRAFYCQGLGLEEAFQLHRDDGSLWIVYLKAGNGTFLELFPQPDFTPDNRPNISYKHVCLRVEGLESMVVGLKEKGIELTSDIQRGKDGNLQAWTRDPDGNRIELMEISPDSKQAAASR
jgi:lactoylglutathione lyase